MSYLNRKKKKPTKAAQKKERNKASAEGDAEWNEFYAQLIEYDMEHGTYQVPVDYVVTADDGRKLALGAWLQVQGIRLNEYARTKPQWYSDILDLIETGKLWFDADSKQDTPINVSFVSPSSSSKVMTSASTNNKPSPPSHLQVTSKAAPAMLSRDYAMDVDSSDDGSDNSMAQDVKRARANPPTGGKSQPSSGNKQSLPTPSNSAQQAKAKQSSSSSKVTVPVIPVVSGKRRGRPPSVPTTSSGNKAVSKSRVKPTSRTTHKRRKANKDSSEDESESESESQAEFQSESEAFSEGSEEWERYDAEVFSAEPDEPTTQKKAAVAPAPSRGNSSASTSVTKPHSTAPTTSKAVTSSSAVSAATSSSSAGTSKPIYTSHSAFAAAVNKEKEKDAARKILAQAASRHTPEPTSRPSVQPTQTPSKTKSVSSSADRVTALTNSLPSAPPAPPTIPVISTSVPPGNGSRDLEPSVSSSVGIMRPEQCIFTATGPLPPRRTLSKPKPLLAPVPTPAPPPMLASCIPAKNGANGTSSAAVASSSTSTSTSTNTSTSTSSTAQSAPLSVPTTNSGALPHIATVPIATKATPAVSFSEMSFTDKIRLMKLQKEKAAAARESPRSDVSVAGSDPPLVQAASAITTTVDCVVTPASGKNNYPSPRDTYSGADAAKKRTSISEHKQCGSASSKGSSTLPYGLLAHGEAQSKESPRTATGTASESSGSPAPNLLPEDDDALETADEKDPSDFVDNDQQQGTEDEKEGYEKNEEEDEESTVVVKGGRRGRLVHGTPRRIDDFGSQLSSQQSVTAATVPSVPSLPAVPAMEQTPRHEMEIISVDDNSTVANVSLSAAQARGVSSMSEVIARAGRDRAPSVMTINSEVTFNDNMHEDTDSSSDEEQEGNGARSATQQESRQSASRALVYTPPASAVTDSACTTAATTSTLTTTNPITTTTVTMVNAAPSAPVFALDLSESEDESVASVLEEDRTKMQHSEEGNLEQKHEFVAFAYTRSTTGAQHPMLGIGMVCNTDEDTSGGGLYLIVMIPENVSDPVRAEYRMDPDEFITVQQQLVLARDLSFVDGARGGVFDARSQAKIRNVLNTYTNLKFDTHFM